MASPGLAGLQLAVQVFVVVSVCVTEAEQLDPLGTWEMTGVVNDDTLP
jgi:hypothetical protein